MRPACSAHHIGPGHLVTVLVLMRMHMCRNEKRWHTIEEYEKIQKILAKDTQDSKHSVSESMQSPEALNTYSGRDKLVARVLSRQLMHLLWRTVASTEDNCVHKWFPPMLVGLLLILAAVAAVRLLGSFKCLQ